ncbi:MAG: hypothetical protein ABII22_03490 [Candidatus Micrarchaeota archaeon]
MEVVLFAFFLSALYLISYLFLGRLPYRYSIKSFSSGMLIFVIFLELFPQIFVNGIAFHNYKLLSLLLVLGFSLYHILDFYIYKKVRAKKKLYHELHSTGFMLDNLLKGFMLVIFFSFSDNFLLLFIPLCFAVVAESLAFSQYKNILPFYFIFCISLFYPIGAYLALFLEEVHIYAVLAVATGAFIYFAIRDEFVKEDHENILAFILGLLFMFAIKFLIL